MVGSTRVLEEQNVPEGSFADKFKEESFVEGQKSDVTKIPQTNIEVVTHFVQGRMNDNETEDQKSDGCESRHLLIKNTDSFRCFAQVLLSNSSIMRQKLYNFPPLIDPGINAAFEYVGT